MKARCCWRSGARPLSWRSFERLDWHPEAARRIRLERRRGCCASLGRRAIRLRGWSKCAARRFTRAALRCNSACCFDWPVCRSHLRVWMNANPIEAAKMRSPVRAVLRCGTAWAAARGLGPGPWVEVRMPVHIDSTTGAILVVDTPTAIVMADWYESRGCAAAELLRSLTMTTAAVPASAQLSLLGGES
jgi:hypothetical protein